MGPATPGGMIFPKSSWSEEGVNGQIVPSRPGKCTNIPIEGNLQMTKTCWAVGPIFAGGNQLSVERPGVSSSYVSGRDSSQCSPCQNIPEDLCQWCDKIRGTI